MFNRITCAFDTPPREGLTWEQRWKGDDRGLIACWERGRDKRRESPDMAKQAEAGELPVLAWKGGVERAIKKTHKYGCLNYLATWQGLRGNDLNIDLDHEVTLVCTRTKMSVTFTGDVAKYMEP